MKSIPVVLAGVAVGLVLAAPGGATAANAKVTIRHQVRGCHNWAVNGGAYRPAQHIRLARGGTVTFVNNDVMPQRLVQKSGPAVRYVGKPNMNHSAASVKVVFKRAGVYRFTTKAGEDYVKGVKTIGEDNVLTLKVVVR
jgi:plastocyanin